ncbi:hypothetical protein LOTGIDRAFT_170574 [Lottia gigantea]|uniref:Vwde helical domain-containing protein n=1 Tax=Lottia gigantea TaxID=225164 RepID=V4CQJ8_LOTGI|nr:hypothetical protein LOTGIDRAFT_170574 [Lottia gigantea]ESP04740.1 hypothetical protein LOTGIDRAFT_170574 [Lottia gigantea]
MAAVKFLKLKNRVTMIIRECGTAFQCQYCQYVKNVKSRMTIKPAVYDFLPIFLYIYGSPNDSRSLNVRFVDDVRVYESNYTDYNDVNKIRSLTDTRLRASGITTLGFQLHCKIRAAVDTDGERMASSPSTSNNKFIGIIVANPVMNMKEGETARIWITSTVPIGCPEGCTLTLTADIPQDEDKKCEPTPTANGVCGISINTEEWNEWYHLEVTSTITEDYGQTVTQKKIFLRTEGLYLDQPIWGDYLLQPVTINIVKDTSFIKGKICAMYSYILYFRDFYRTVGSKSYFQLVGTYFLLQMDNVEVQVKLTDCSGEGTGYCVCGVVVRVGRTAFMINHCNLGYWYIDYILCDDGGDMFCVRKRGDTEFEIYLPSDTKIQIYLNANSNANWLNVEIFPSIRDIGRTSGLCGELIADPPAVQYNDIYFNSFRVLRDVNLFNPTNSITLPVLRSNNTVRFEHCLCDEEISYKVENTVNCSPVPGATTCSSDTAYTLFHKKRCINPLRKKRSLPRGSQPQILHHRRLRRDVRWKNGWTMDSASEYCSGLFNNSMVIKRCEGIRGINIEGAIETCVSDIQLSGTDVFAPSALSSVRSQCLRKARMNRVLREKRVENGKCICNSGYIGSDCSVSLNKPPLAHNLEADGHCDLSLDDCTEVAVFGGRFVDAEQTKCILLPFEIKNDQVTVSEERIIQTALFESIGEVTCKLPSRKRRLGSVDVPVIDETVTGYKVSVSNNGQNYSQQLNFIIYNTECINCNIDNSNKIICTFSSNYCIIDAICYSNGLFQSNYCIIDAICYSNGLFQPDHCIMENICYSNGDVCNTGDTEFICQANSNGKTWNPDGIDAVVIGISVVAVVVIIVVILHIIVCLKRTRSVVSLLCSSLRPLNIVNIHPTDLKSMKSPMCLMIDDGFVPANNRQY